MKNVFVALVIGVILASILVACLALRKGSTPERETVELSNRPGREAEATAEVAQQILTDMSEAKVDENTKELRTAFSHLNTICKKAVETREAMLTAKYNLTDGNTVNNEKGVEHGNE